MWLPLEVWLLYINIFRQVIFMSCTFVFLKLDDLLQDSTMQFLFIIIIWQYLLDVPSLTVMLLIRAICPLIIFIIGMYI